MNFVRVIINLFQFNRTNWKAVFLCVLAATIFWFFNAFNKNHSSTIRFPLRFEYDQAHYVPVNPLPHQININVMGTGWDLVRKTLGFKLPELIIELDRPLEIKKIAAGSLTPLLNSQLGSLQINYIAIDTLRVHLDEKVEKTFRLSIDTENLIYKEGFGNTGVINVLPDTVVIDGPESIVLTIPDTIFLSVKTNPLSKTFHDEVEVPLFKSESINRNPPVVTVVIEVAPMETMEVLLKLTLLNQPRSAKNRFADSVKVRIKIPASQRDEFHALSDQLSATIDFKNVKNDSYIPAISGLPIYARVVSIDSLSYKVD